VTDRQTDRRNCDSICALSIYAVARKKMPRVTNDTSGPFCWQYYSYIIKI